MSKQNLEYEVSDIEGKIVDKVQLDSGIFGEEIKKHIVAEVVRWQLAKRRAGTHKSLTRSEVRGTTKKCKPQKEQGTRHGDKRAPIFRKGGHTHAKSPKSYLYSLNKKFRMKGLKIALSDKFNTKNLKIVDSLDLKTCKTAGLRKSLEKLGLTKALFVSDNFSENFEKAVSNIPYMNKLPIVGLNVYDALRHKQLVITKTALSALSSRLT